MNESADYREVAKRLDHKRRLSDIKRFVDIVFNSPEFIALYGDKHTEPANQCYCVNTRLL